MDDYRKEMSLAEFQALPIDPADPISSLWDPLIDANPRLMAEDFEDTASLTKFTAGMRLFLLLGAFDGQVCNGGIAQFFWNCPASIFPVRDALDELGEGELLGMYDRAVESLVGNREQWHQLREKWAQLVPGDEAWEPFRQSYELLDLGWFDKAYFHQRGFNEAGQWIVLREGLKGPFSQRLVEYVKVRPADFIVM